MVFVVEYLEMQSFSPGIVSFEIQPLHQIAVIVPDNLCRMILQISPTGVFKRSNDLFSFIPLPSGTRLKLCDQFVIAGFMRGHVKQIFVISVLCIILFIYLLGFICSENYNLLILAVQDIALPWRSVIRPINPGRTSCAVK